MRKTAILHLSSILAGITAGALQEVKCQNPQSFERVMAALTSSLRNQDGPTNSPFQLTNCAPFSDTEVLQVLENDDVVPASSLFYNVVSARISLLSRSTDEAPRMVSSTSNHHKDPAVLLAQLRKNVSRLISVVAPINQRRVMEASDVTTRMASQFPRTPPGAVDGAFVEPEHERFFHEALAAAGHPLTGASLRIERLLLPAAFSKERKDELCGGSLDGEAADTAAGFYIDSNSPPLNPDYSVATHRVVDELLSSCVLTLQSPKTFLRRPSAFGEERGANNTPFSKKLDTNSISQPYPTVATHIGLLPEEVEALRAVLLPVHEAMMHIGLLTSSAVCRVFEALASRGELNAALAVGAKWIHEAHINHVGGASIAVARHARFPAGDFGGPVERNLSSWDATDLGGLTEDHLRILFPISAAEPTTNASIVDQDTAVATACQSNYHEPSLYVNSFPGRMLVISAQVAAATYSANKKRLANEVFSEIIERQRQLQGDDGDGHLTKGTDAELEAMSSALLLEEGDLFVQNICGMWVAGEEGLVALRRDQMQNSAVRMQRGTSDTTIGCGLSSDALAAYRSALFNRARAYLATASSSSGEAAAPSVRGMLLSPSDKVRLAILVAIGALNGRGTLSHLQRLYASLTTDAEEELQCLRELEAGASGPNNNVGISALVDPSSILAVVRYYRHHLSSQSASAAMRPSTTSTFRRRVPANPAILEEDFRRELAGLMHSAKKEKFGPRSGGVEGTGDRSPPSLFGVSPLPSSTRKAFFAASTRTKTWVHSTRRTNFLRRLMTFSAEVGDVMDGAIRLVHLTMKDVLLTELNGSGNSCGLPEHLSPTAAASSTMDRVILREVQSVVSETLAAVLQSCDDNPLAVVDMEYSRIASYLTSSSASAGAQTRLSPQNGKVVATPPQATHALSPIQGLLFPHKAWPNILAIPSLRFAQEWEASIRGQLVTGGDNSASPRSRSPAASRLPHNEFLREATQLASDVLSSTERESKPARPVFAPSTVGSDDDRHPSLNNSLRTTNPFLLTLFPDPVLEDQLSLVVLESIGSHIATLGGTVHSNRQELARLIHGKASRVGDTQTSEGGGGKSFATSPFDELFEEVFAGEVGSQKRSSKDLYGLARLKAAVLNGAADDGDLVPETVLSGASSSSLKKGSEATFPFTPARPGAKSEMTKSIHFPSSIPRDHDGWWSNPRGGFSNLPFHTVGAQDLSEASLKVIQLNLTSKILRGHTAGASPLQHRFTDSIPVRVLNFNIFRRAYLLWVSTGFASGDLAVSLVRDVQPFTDPDVSGLLTRHLLFDSFCRSEFSQNLLRGLGRCALPLPSSTLAPLSPGALGIGRGRQLLISSTQSVISGKALSELDEAALRYVESSPSLSLERVGGSILKEEIFRGLLWGLPWPTGTNVEALITSAHTDSEVASPTPWFSYLVSNSLWQTSRQVKGIPTRVLSEKTIVLTLELAHHGVVHRGLLARRAFAAYNQSTVGLKSKESRNALALLRHFVGDGLGFDESSLTSHPYAPSHRVFYKLMATVLRETWTLSTPYLLDNDRVSTSRMMQEEGDIKALRRFVLGSGFPLECCSLHSVNSNNTAMIFNVAPLWTIVSGAKGCIALQFAKYLQGKGQAKGLCTVDSISIESQREYSQRHDAELANLLLATPSSPQLSSFTDSKTTTEVDFEQEVDSKGDDSDEPEDDSMEFFEELSREGPASAKGAHPAKPAFSGTDSLIEEGRDKGWTSATENSEGFSGGRIVSSPLPIAPALFSKGAAREYISTMLTSSRDTMGVMLMLINPSVAAALGHVDTLVGSATRGPVVEGEAVPVLVSLVSTLPPGGASGGPSKSSVAKPVKHALPPLRKSPTSPVAGFAPSQSLTPFLPVTKKVLADIGDLLAYCGIRPTFTTTTSPLEGPSTSLRLSPKYHAAPLMVTGLPPLSADYIITSLALDASLPVVLPICGFTPDAAAESQLTAAELFDDLLHHTHSSTVRFALPPNMRRLVQLKNGLPSSAPVSLELPTLCAVQLLRLLLHCDGYRDLVERMLLAPSEVTTNPTVPDVLSGGAAVAPDYTRATGLYEGLRWACGQSLNYLAQEKRAAASSLGKDEKSAILPGLEPTMDYGRVFPTMASGDPTSVLFPSTEMPPMSPFYNPNRQHAYFSVASASGASSPLNKRTSCNETNSSKSHIGTRFRVEVESQQP